MLLEEQRDWTLRLLLRKIVEWGEDYNNGNYISINISEDDVCVSYGGTTLYYSADYLLNGERK